MKNTSSFSLNFHEVRQAFWKSDRDGEAWEIEGKRRLKAAVLSGGVELGQLDCLREYLSR